jgi:hypothetical protein
MVGKQEVKERCQTGHWRLLFSTQAMGAFLRAGARKNRAFQGSAIASFQDKRIEIFQV